MLQTENDKLRTRIKTLNETVDQLTVRNSELLADQAVMALGNAAGDASSEEVVNLIKGYVKELEELRYTVYLRKQFLFLYSVHICNKMIWPGKKNYLLPLT